MICASQPVAGVHVAGRKRARPSPSPGMPTELVLTTRAVNHLTKGHVGGAVTKTLQG